MPCPFAEGNQSLPISVVHDFADLPKLLAQVDRKKVGNPITPGSELPTEDFDDDADAEQEEDDDDDEQRRRDDRPKDNPCI